STALIIPRSFSNHHLGGGLVLGNPILCQNPAPVYIGINYRSSSDDCARVEHRVATNIGLVAQDGAELPQAGVVSFSVALNLDVPRHQFHIGHDDPRAKVRSITQNRVSDVVEMRGYHPVEQYRVLNLARVPDYAAVSDNNLLPDIGIMPNLAITPNDRR